MSKLFTTAQRSLLEELESVVARRVQGGSVSLVCAAGVTQALREGQAILLDAAINDQATEALGLTDEGDDGEGWKHPAS